MPESPQELPNLDRLDRDGALREAAESVGHTRGAFMRRTGAFVGGGLLLGGIPVAFALAQDAGLPSGDVDILNYALTLEYLEAAFYKEAVDGGALSGETKTFADVVAGHEADHVSALKKTLGSKAVAKPKFDFQGTTRSQSKFQQTAMTLEDLGVTAYQGQATKIKSGAVLKAAGSILPVEARHAAWMRDIVGSGDNPSPAPDAFNPSRTMSEVLSIVQSTNFISSMPGASSGAGSAVNGRPRVTG